jgi:hypothetical protein
MTSILKQYEIRDFDEIRENGFSIVLPEATLKMINMISEQVGSLGYVKTPAFHKKMKKNGKNDKHDASHTGRAIDPALLEKYTFKSYAVKEAKDVNAIETHTTEIMTCLNKIAPKSFDMMSEKITGHMESIIEISDDKDEDPFVKVCTYIFDYATTNKMGVALYARLYVGLMEKFPILTGIFKKKFSNYLTMFNKVENNNNNLEDYDYFCKITAINQKRRSFSLFIIELYKNGVVDIDKIVSIIISLQSDLVYSVNWNNETTKCEEISENVYIFIANMCPELMKHASWSVILGNISTIKDTKVGGDAISMTNKIKFKHMDMNDVIKKVGVYRSPGDSR